MLDRDSFASFVITRGDAAISIQASYNNADWSELYAPHPVLPDAYGTLQYGINLASGTYIRVIGSENQSMPEVKVYLHELIT